jgi:hypothetical protein
LINTSSHVALGVGEAGFRGVVLFHAHLVRAKESVAPRAQPKMSLIVQALHEGCAQLRFLTRAGPNQFRAVRNGLRAAMELSSFKRIRYTIFAQQLLPCGNAAGEKPTTETLARPVAAVAFITNASFESTRCG